MNCFHCDKRTLKSCKIYSMLQENAKKKHLSFHTPGHKAGGWDITELSFSDNLSCPHGVLRDAEREIADVLGSAASFILTDGSTAGIFSMLQASGVKRLAVPRLSHKSVFNACRLLGVKIVFIETPMVKKIPLQPPRAELNEKLKQADALLLTSPDYYGNLVNLKEARALCEIEGKLLLIDGAHGGHLHSDKEHYAGAYADLWVDGVHKSLPALTQGAVVSARTPALARKLKEAVDVFRTTSPSYPIMASVEYAVKYPRNEALEEAVCKLVAAYPAQFHFGGDWTKLCAIFGPYAFTAQKRLEKKGVYAEFCDGNILMFYLSPATKLKNFTKLKKQLLPLLSAASILSDGGSAAFGQAPKDIQRLARLLQREEAESDCTDLEGEEKEEAAQNVFSPLSDGEKQGEDFSKEQTEWVSFTDAAGRIAAKTCGLFPPCTPLIRAGERITEEKIRLLRRADHCFGVDDGRLCVFR